jgi:hypothetical protein
VARASALRVRDQRGEPLVLDGRALWVDDDARHVDTGGDRDGPASAAQDHQRGTHRRLGVSPVGVAEAEERDDLPGSFSRMTAP